MPVGIGRLTRKTIVFATLAAILLMVSLAGATLAYAADLEAPSIRSVFTNGESSSDDVVEAAACDSYGTPCTNILLEKSDLSAVIGMEQVVDYLLDLRKSDRSMAHSLATVVRHFYGSDYMIERSNRNYRYLRLKLMLEDARRNVVTKLGGSWVRISDPIEHSVAYKHLGARKTAT